MSSRTFATEQARRGGTITITPKYKGDKFPAFTEIEIKDGVVKGWVIGAKPRDTEYFEFGYIGGALEVVSHDTDKVVLKRK